MQISVELLTASDDAIIRQWLRLWNEIGKPAGSFEIHVAEGNVATLSGNLENMAKDPTILALRKAKVAIFRTGFIQMPGSGHMTVTVTRAATGVDTLVVNIQDRFGMTEAVPLFIAARDAFSEFDRTAVLSKRLGPELSEYVQRRESSIASMEQVTQRLIEQNTEYRRSVDLEFTAARNQTFEEVAAERQALREEAERAARLVEAREVALEAKKKELDDRGHMHVRRDIREQLKRTLADRAKSFALTPETVEKRRPTAIAFWIFIGAAAVLTSLAASHAYTDVSTPSLIRLLLSVASLFGVLTFYIRWSDDWSKRHAEEEFKLKRLELDFDRASWVVEMALEWSDEKDGAIPPELVDALTQNLFALESERGRARHPAEDVFATLLGASTELTVPFPGGAQLKYNGKGIKRAQSELGKDA